LSQEGGEGATIVVLDAVGIVGGVPVTGDAEAPGKIAVAVARRVEELLKDSGSVEVVLTQKGEEDIDIKERVRRINTSGGHILVSIRVDASEFSNLRGIGIYCVNEAVDLGGQKYEGNAREDMDLAVDLVYLRHQYHSLLLAGFFKREIEQSVPTKFWGVKLLPLYILKRANMASVMVVVGYASNEEELGMLKDASYVEVLSRAVAGAILSYKRHLEVSGEKG
jgi:N-acetylmuramoyl-L-alanine amidase